MLTFFRKIRRKVLTDGLLSNYLLYAIGEIFLIVIGILIALQINNWNEWRIKQNVLASHLESLAEAIKHDIREHGISMEFNEFRYHSLQYLLKMSGISHDSLAEMMRPHYYIEDEVWEGSYPDTINQDLIDRTMKLHNNAFLGFVFNTSAIEEINNLGILSDMQNDTLKVMISEYYYFLNWRYGETTVTKKHLIAENLKDHLREAHTISCNYPPGPEVIIEAIRKDQKLQILIKDLIKEGNDQYWAALDLHRRAKTLEQALRNRI